MGKLFCDSDLNSYLLEILSKDIEFEVEAAVTPPSLSWKFLYVGNSI